MSVSERGGIGVEATQGGRGAEEVIRAHRERLFPWVRPYYHEPLVLDRGEGVWVRDVEGREYLDLFSGILTTSVGHAHPVVVDAVDRQMRRLGHTSTLYVTEPQVEAARLLAELTPGELSVTAFTNSGTEAVETAVMAAFAHTGRRELVVLRHAYSGRSVLATGVSGHAPWKPLGTSLPGVVHARAPYRYRSPLGEEAPEEAHTDFFIDDLVEVIETATSGRPAALLVETIQGVGGFVVPPPGYLRRAADVIRSYGGLFIADEVQTGFGRTGDRWFGVEHFGVEPDLMVMAKGIANGFPVGATVARPEVAEGWRGKSISTFGGNPVSMAAARATIEVLREEEAPRRAREMGDCLGRGLEGLRDEHPWIGEVRGMGLMRALELVEDRETKEPAPRRAKGVLEAAKEEGLLVGVGGLHAHVVRIGPSLLITEEEVDEGIARLARACERAGAEE